MKREIKIYFLYALLFSLPYLFFGLFLLLCSLPVHAAESSSFLLVSNAGEFTSKQQTDYNQEVFTYVGKCSDKNYFYALAFNGDTASDNRKRFLFYKYQIGSVGSPVRSSYDSPIDVVAYGVRENGESYSRIPMTGYTGYDGFLLYCDDDGKYIDFESTLPIFDSVDSMKNYCLTGDTSGLLNGGGSIDNPDFEDAAYSFTGFTANNKMTATWTGTTARTYLQDQEVEEYVRVNYYFADKEAQDTIKQADAYPDEFATADKTLSIDVSGLKPDDENWFLRYIRITPCYRQSGLGAWGDFYHGSDVFVYFDVNGKVESIVQNSVPTDGEVIGNNISLIGFRYDTSFHAEFVDVWSNAVNCSAFDLGGSQYLSLGVKALYYNGQSKDIDFVSLDRKNLVWDKTFDSFKTFNGSGIKQLFFTPYIKTGVNNPWNKGNSIVIDFDVNGNATSSFDTGDDGTVHLSDFKLTGVVWNKPMLTYGTITWAGTTANSDMSIVPDSDTLVVCSYPVYDSSLNESYETYDTVTIGKGSIRVYIDSLIDKYTNAGKTWNGEMWLTPCYKKGGVLYMGEPVIVNCTKGTVSDIEVDESTGTANQVDKTDENKSYADAILSSGNNFFSIVKGLIASMQQLPELIATLFSFFPGWVNALIAGSIFVIFVCRILGR